MENALDKIDLTDDRFTDRQGKRNYNSGIGRKQENVHREIQRMDG